ncbi:unnamed protein product [Mytilus coruscus]|uniref:Farnesoic acid O-methyl transferase domain-containing protein n=1 Tax=Mytilus coruscus TaxID=42192 RepID=A0A6J8B7E6_MYTCO|nr:unnamed protein product [Mytilus coruscus]
MWRISDGEFVELARKVVPNLLACFEMTMVWVTWNSGVITFGTGNPETTSNGLLTGTDYRPFTIYGIGVTSITHGEWKFIIKEQQIADKLESFTVMIAGKRQTIMIRAMVKNISVENTMRRKITTKALKQFVKKRIERNIQENDVICEKCRAIYRKTLKNVNNEQKVSNCLSECISDDSDSEFVINIEEAVSTKILSPKQIELNISSIHTSHRFCIVCKKEGSSRNKLCKVPLQARTQAFIKNAVFIDGNTRCFIYLNNFSTTRHFKH